MQLYSKDELIIDLLGVLTYMATPSELVDAGMLVRIDAGLEGWEQEFRCIFCHPRAITWIDEVLPALDTDGFTESVQSPLEQVDDIFYRFASGEEDIADLPPHSMQPADPGVWELRTYDVRIFGWFWRKGIFIVSAFDTAFRCKKYSLYSGYREQSVRDRDALSLDPPPYITGAIIDVL